MPTTTKKPTYKFRPIKTSDKLVVPTGFKLGQLAASKLRPGGLDTLRTTRTAAAELQKKSTVSGFTFQITGIGSAPLRDRHENFNRAFVEQFPKLLYTNPSSQYTDAGFAGLTLFGGQSQIHAVGESALSGGATKAIIIQLLQNAGITISSNINFDQHTIREFEQGAILKTPVYTAPNPGRTNTARVPGTNVEVPDLSNIELPGGNLFESLGKLLGLDGLAKSLGLVAGTATVTALVVGGIFLVVMLKK